MISKFFAPTVGKSLSRFNYAAFSSFTINLVNTILLNKNIPITDNVLSISRESTLLTDLKVLSYPLKAQCLLRSYLSYTRTCISCVKWNKLAINSTSKEKLEVSAISTMDKYAYLVS